MTLPVPVILFIYVAYKNQSLRNLPYLSLDYIDFTQYSHACLHTLPYKGSLNISISSVCIHKGRTQSNNSLQFISFTIPYFCGFKIHFVSSLHTGKHRKRTHGIQWLIIASYNHKCQHKQYLTFLLPACCRILPWNDFLAKHFLHIVASYIIPSKNQ